MAFDPTKWPSDRSGNSGNNGNGAASIIFAKRTYANFTSNNAVAGVRSTPSLYNTSTAGSFTGALYGVYTGPSVSALNTQNWTSNLVGVAGAPSVVSGASGSISNIMGGYFSISIGSMAASNAYGTYISGISTSGSGTVSSAAGIAVSSIAAGTNNSQLLLGTTTIPTGNYGIYDTSGYQEYFALAMSASGRRCRMIVWM